MSPSTVRVPIHARAVRTRRRLVEAAAREFAERGYSATTARTIAERAGTATGSFYQYFRDKDAALAEITAARQAELATRLTGAYSDLQTAPGDSLTAGQVQSRLAEVVSIVIDYHREDPALHGVISERRNADPELGKIVARGEQIVIGAIQHLIERWSAHADPTAVAFILYGMVEGCVHAHVLGERLVSNERFVSALVAATTRVAFPVHPTRGTEPNGVPTRKRSHGQKKARNPSIPTRKGVR